MDNEEDIEQVPQQGGIGYTLRHPIQSLKNRLTAGFSFINAERKKKKKSLFKRVWEKIPLKLKIFIIIGMTIFVLILVILMAIGDDTSKKAVSTRSNGVSKLSINDQSPSASQFALELYNKYDSLIGFSTSDLQIIYDNFLADTSNKNAYLLSSGRKKFGSSTGEKYTINQELSLYQHIQRAEKYNFNKIKWKEFTHTTDDVDIETELREELEIYVPKGIDDETYETILKTTSPYLFTQDIPLGLLAGLVAKSGGISSQQSNISEKFVYQLLKEAMSKIKVHKYVLQNITLQSFYDDCDYNRYEQTYYVNSYENGYEVFLSEDEPILKESRNEVTEEKKIDGTEKYNSETYWYVAEALVYDRIINNVFKHERYSEADVESLRNPDNNTLIDTQPIDELSEVVQAKSINSNGSIPTDDNGNPKSPTRVSKQYIYIQKQGKKYIYEKQWKDKLTTEKSENKEYTYDTAKEFNTKTNDDYSHMPTDKSIIAEDEFDEKFPNGKSIFDNYTKENTSVKLYGMSIIDLMNTNRGVYSKYINKGSSSKSLEAISRSELKPAYNQVKNILNSLIKKSDKNYSGMNFNSYTTGQADGVLPFVYGSSLGFSTSNSGANSSNSNFISGINLLKEYLRACEGIGYSTDPPSTKIVEEGEQKYYRVAKNGTVGYGVDLSQNEAWKIELEGQMNSTIVFGETLIPVELVDAIEERFMNEQLATVEAKFPDLKMYQKHALVVRMYNWPDISGFSNYYPSRYNESTDDMYEAVYEEFKDNQTATNQIKAKAKKDSVLYTEYLSTPNKGDGGAVSLEGRRFSEWCLFSLGYYDKLQKFYTEGGNTPVGDLVDSNGVINQDKVYELQLWYEDNIFCGAFHAQPGQDFKLDSNCQWYSAITESYAKQVRPSQNGVVGGEFYDYARTLSGYKAVGNYIELGMFQCTWWSNCRQAQYLTEMGYTGTIKFDGHDGKGTAAGLASAYGLPLNNNIQEVRAHSVMSEGTGGTGHTYFCEAVGTNAAGHRCLVVSHCGSGHAWHGVDIIDLETHPYMFYSTFQGSVCLDDLL